MDDTSCEVRLLRYPFSGASYTRSYRSYRCMHTASPHKGSWSLDLSPSGVLESLSLSTHKGSCGFGISVPVVAHSAFFPKPHSECRVGKGFMVALKPSQSKDPTRRCASQD